METKEEIKGVNSIRLEKRNDVFFSCDFYAVNGHNAMDLSGDDVRDLMLKLDGIVVKDFQDIKTHHPAEADWINIQFDDWDNACKIDYLGTDPYAGEMRKRGILIECRHEKHKK